MLAVLATSEKHPPNDHPVPTEFLELLPGSPTHDEAIIYEKGDQYKIVYLYDGDHHKFGFDPDAWEERLKAQEFEARAEHYRKQGDLIGQGARGAFSKTEMTEIIHIAAHMQGRVVPDSDIPYILEIVDYESDFNPHAQNPRSSAYGLFQFLNGTWDGYGYAKTSDPIVQTMAGLNYIYRRYNSPQRARGSQVSRGWY